MRVLLGQGDGQFASSSSEVEHMIEFGEVELLGKVFKSDVFAIVHAVDEYLKLLRILVEEVEKINSISKLILRSASL